MTGLRHKLNYVLNTFVKRTPGLFLAFVFTYGALRSKMFRYLKKIYCGINKHFQTFQKGMGFLCDLLIWNMNWCLAILVVCIRSPCKARNPYARMGMRERICKISKSKGK